MTGAHVGMGCRATATARIRGKTFGWKTGRSCVGASDFNMLKIVVNLNKRDVIHSFTEGQTFPDVKGKLISVEASGRELIKLLEKREITFTLGTNTSLTWHGSHAGRVLRDLREIFNG